ncbi:MAG: DUF4426 domain-containing protein [Halomonas sp.]|uniref:DUF4426 domain-containing protein n=1 Tax=Billgrantia antri TaxID=2846777 RepID=UPI001F5EE3BC|nr:DUF4426 domain-containing protein [Halomonas sulfidivorans]MDX5379524.1 DUF4426 domain-containing protein [Halomonas sp.]MDX5504331.1 DUF4426 domain-containing protein [Halomonas sp.]
MLKRIVSRHRVLAIALLLGLLPLAGQAQQFEQVGDYQVHYSAVSTSFLPQSVAEAHGIQRSPAMALLNVSVLEEVDGELRPVNASVSGTVGEVQGSERTPLSFRTLRSGDTQSQIAVFRIRDDEPMHFTLDVRYDRNREPAEVSFIQRFHIER